jgi:hypothetical protein
MLSPHFKFILKLTPFPIIIYTYYIEHIELIEHYNINAI